jgi:hypothetical protein
VAVQEFAKIAEVKVPRGFRNSAHNRTAERLHRHLVAAPSGYVGDRQITDAWARELGVEGWYEWVRHGYM